MKRGRGAAGSASDWQSGGHGFESRRLHFLIKKEWEMKRILILVTVFIIFAGCEAKGGFRDQAYIMKAEKTLVRIRNTLQEYKLDHGAYPGNGTDLGKVLEPYFVKEIVHDGDNIPPLSMEVMSGVNTIDQVQGVILEFKKRLFYAESSFAAPYLPHVFALDSALSCYRLELTKLEDCRVSAPLPHIAKIDTMIQQIDLEKLAEDIERNIKVKAADVVSAFQSFREAVEGFNPDEEVQNLLAEIEKGVEAYRKDSIPEDMKDPDEFVDKIIKHKKFKKKKIIKETGEELKHALVALRYARKQRDLPDFIKDMKRRIPKSFELLKEYIEKKRDSAKRAALIVMAQDKLRKIKPLIDLYKKENGTLPTGDLSAALSSCKGWEELTSLFAGAPVLEETENGYIVRARVNNPEKTEIMIWVERVNEWDKLISESFSWGPVYETIDSTRTFFVKARAQDSYHTLLGIRPQIVKKEEE